MSDEQVVQTEVKTTEVTERNWEAEASAEGWRPKEEFKGPPERWIEAKEFVERGEKFAPIIKAKNRKLEEKMAEMQAATAQYTAFMNQQLAESRRRQETLLEDLRTAKAKAIEDGNGKAVINFERQMEQVQTQMASTAPQPIDPSVVQWRSKNAWYGSDEDASDFADAVGYKYRAKNPGATPAQVLEHITEKVQARFPEYSEIPRVQQRTTKPASPEGGTTTAKAAPGSAKKPSLADLPDDESRLVARRIIKSMGTTKDGKPIMTEEAYMKSYNNQK